jgi:hypothetical protein
MADDKTKTGGPDRRRVASNEVEDFHQKHKHLTHKQARGADGHSSRSTMPAGRATR